ncbi:cell division protein FtsQ/DivIB [Pelagibacterium xiamenense]|uniref:cell division protein FtsQ/DivIB n=1 Tax=Pelagibacterium xiamenense TaxID=2901140 RepID=UPI001E477434|nr:cell division protein FtsQ/DivIB [Pelagibacterium xiamenense]MCD7060132.1 FtsQ-type POTRA domain-containing protein [Pelagibacterium xiamenense]
MQQVRRAYVPDDAPGIETATRPHSPAPKVSRPSIKPVAPMVPLARERSPAVARRNLPVSLKRRRGVLVGLGHLWVLHRTLVLRAAALVIVAAGLLGAYVFRDEIGQGAMYGADIVSGRAAQAGLGVAQISMTGQALTREADIIAALDVDDFTTTFTFDAEAARQRIEKIASVESATIRKIYPDTLDVMVTEKTPVARWRIDGETYLIDATGAPIARARFENGDLPLVIGAGAGDDALAMVNLIERFPAVTGDLAALVRIADRRWDLVYFTGLRVQLPESGVVPALERLGTYQADYQLLDRDLDLIDMRVPEYVAVRPTQREEEDPSS